MSETNERPQALKSKKQTATMKRRALKPKSIKAAAIPMKARSPEVPHP